MGRESPPSTSGRKFPTEDGGPQGLLSQGSQGLARKPGQQGDAGDCRLTPDEVAQGDLVDHNRLERREAEVQFHEGPGLRPRGLRSLPGVLPVRSVEPVEAAPPAPSPALSPKPTYGPDRVLQQLLFILGQGTPQVFDGGIERASAHPLRGEEVILQGPARPPVDLHPRPKR